MTFVLVVLGVAALMTVALWVITRSWNRRDDRGHDPLVSPRLPLLLDQVDQVDQPMTAEPPVEPPTMAEILEQFERLEVELGRARSQRRRFDDLLAASERIVAGGDADG